MLMAATSVTQVQPDALPSVQRRRFQTLRLLFSSTRARVTGAFLLLIAVISVVGPWLTPYESAQQELADRLQGPSAEHWLGTDSFGRDMLTLLFDGSALSLMAGVEAVAVAVLLGVPTGLLAGYAGGWFGAASNALSDTLLSLPPLVLALAIVGIRGGGVHNAMLAVGITLAPRFFRVARGVAKTVSQETYIEAARSIGCRTSRILGRHVLVNAIAPIMVQVTFSLGLAIIAEASLSFLGIGTEPPDVSLGTMVRDGFDHIREASFPIFPASIMIAVIVFLFSSLGDALRDALVTGGKR